MIIVLSMFSKVFSRILLLLSVLWLAGCGNLPVPDLGRALGGSGGTVKVALLVPHGSAVGGEQKLARDLENAARMAVSDLQGGADIQLTVYGTAGNAARAREAAMNAVADGAQIIVGPLHAESANAVAVAVAGQNVNVLAFSNNPTIAGGNLFILGQTFQSTANRLVSFAVGQGRNRILTVYSNNLAGQIGRDAIQRAIAANGAVPAGTISHDFSQQGVVAAVPQIKAAASANAANAMFLTANTAGALPLLSQMLPEAGLSPSTIQYVGLARWDTPAQTLELPGVQGGWFALPDPQRSAQFRSRFEAAYGDAPHALAGLSYDGIAAIGALAGRRGGISREALTQPAGFQGVNGIFRFNPDGTNSRGLAVASIQNRQVVVISPAPQGFGGAGF